MTLPTLPEVVDLALADADAELAADVKCAFDVLKQKIGGIRGLPSTKMFVMVEPRVVEHYIMKARLLPRGHTEPPEDPGPQAAQEGAPWRGFTGLERGFLFRIFELAREKAGMSVAFPQLSVENSTGGQVSSSGSVDPATKSLLEALQRSEARQQARDEGCIFKPSQWGDALDDQDMLACSDEELTGFFAAYKAAFHEEPPLSHRPTREQMTLLMRRLIPSRTDPKLATGKDVAFPFLDMALFQPAGRTRKDRMKVEKLLPQADGSMKRIVQPGVPDHGHWLSSWLLHRTCFRCLGPCLTPAAEEAYPRLIEDMRGLYPDCWGIIVEAEELMRLERIPERLREIRADGTAGPAFQQLPLTAALSKLVVDATKDREFWQKHVHDKCLSVRTFPALHAAAAAGGTTRKRTWGDLEAPSGTTPAFPPPAPDPAWGRGPNGKGKGKGKGGKGKDKQVNPQNPPGTRRTICVGYQGNAIDQVQCKSSPCPTMCPVTRRPQLHVCSKCRKDHPPPRGASCTHN